MKACSAAQNERASGAAQHRKVGVAPPPAPRSQMPAKAPKSPRKRYPYALPPTKWQRRDRWCIRFCETLQNKVQIIPKISKMVRSEKLCLAEAKLFGLNPKQPKEFGVKFRSIKIRGIFPHKLSNFKLGKMPKSLTFRFPEGRYFLNFDNT